MKYSHCMNHCIIPVQKWSHPFHPTVQLHGHAQLSRTMNLTTDAPTWLCQQLVVVTFTQELPVVSSAGGPSLPPPLRFAYFSDAQILECFALPQAKYFIFTPKNGEIKKSEQHQKTVFSRFSLFVVYVLGPKVKARNIFDFVEVCFCVCRLCVSVCVCVCLCVSVPVSACEESNMCASFQRASAEKVTAWI